MARPARRFAARPLQRLAFSVQHCRRNSSQAMAATYKYDPYGRTLSSSGTLASANIYRFSSKEIHPNSGFYYYGFRFYDPNTQRWLNRDPIGEKGGKNLYRFVGNDPSDKADPLGLSDENRPPDVADSSGNATYGPPGRLSPEQCAALLAQILGKEAKLATES